MDEVLPAEFAGMAALNAGVLDVGGVTLPVRWSRVPVYVRRCANDLAIVEVAIAVDDSLAKRNSTQGTQRPTGDTRGSNRGACRARGRSRDLAGKARPQRHYHHQAQRAVHHSPAPGMGACERPAPRLHQGERVPGQPTLFRLEHLSIDANGKAPKRPRSAAGTGSKRQVRPGVWKLAVSVGRYADGSKRRLHRTVRARNETEATAQLVAFVAAVRDETKAPRKDLRDIKVDAAMELFLDEHLREEKGREERTVNDYRRLHRKWFSPAIGKRRVRDVDEETIDRIFGRMRRAGLSRSRMNQCGASTHPSPVGRGAGESSPAIRCSGFSCPQAGTSRQNACSRTLNPSARVRLPILLRLNRRHNGRSETRGAL